MNEAEGVVGALTYSTAARWTVTGKYRLDELALSKLESELFPDVL